MGAIKSGIGPFEGLDHASPEPDQIAMLTDQIAGAFNAKVA
jgi:hypothetical protein